MVFDIVFLNIIKYNNQGADFELKSDSKNGVDIHKTKD